MARDIAHQESTLDHDFAANTEAKIIKIGKQMSTNTYWPKEIVADAIGLADVVRGATPITLQNEFAVSPAAAKGCYRHVRGWLEKAALARVMQACVDLFNIYSLWLDDWSHDTRMSGLSRKLVLHHKDSTPHPNEGGSKTRVVDLDKMLNRPASAALATIFLGLEEQVRTDMAIPPTDPSFDMALNFMSSLSEPHVDQPNKDGPGGKIYNAHINKPALTAFSKWSTKDSCLVAKGTCAAFSDAGDLTGFWGNLRTNALHGVFQEGNAESLNFKITKDNVHLTRISITFRFGTPSDEQLATMVSVFPTLFEDTDSPSEGETGDEGEEPDEDGEEEADSPATRTAVRHYTYTPATPVSSVNIDGTEVSMYNSVQLALGKRQTKRPLTFAVGDTWRYAADESRPDVALRVALIATALPAGRDRYTDTVVFTQSSVESGVCLGLPLILHGPALKKFLGTTGLPEPCAKGTAPPPGGPSVRDLTEQRAIRQGLVVRWKGPKYNREYPVAKAVWGDRPRHGGKGATEVSGPGVSAVASAVVDALLETPVTAAGQQPPPAQRVAGQQPSTEPQGGQLSLGGMPTSQLWGGLSALGMGMPRSSPGVDGLPSAGTGLGGSVPLRTSDPQLNRILGVLSDVHTFFHHQSGGAQREQMATEDRARTLQEAAHMRAAVNTTTAAHLQAYERFREEQRVQSMAMIDKLQEVTKLAIMNDQRRIDAEEKRARKARKAAEAATERAKQAEEAAAERAKQAAEAAQEARKAAEEKAAKAKQAAAKKKKRKRRKEKKKMRRLMKRLRASGWDGSTAGPLPDSSSSESTSDSDSS